MSPPLGLQQGSQRVISRSPEPSTQHITACTKHRTEWNTLDATRLGKSKTIEDVILCFEQCLHATWVSLMRRGIQLFLEVTLPRVCLFVTDKLQCALKFVSQSKTHSKHTQYFDTSATTLCAQVAPTLADSGQVPVAEHQS